MLIQGLNRRVERIMKTKKMRIEGLATGRYALSIWELVKNAIANAGIDVSTMVLRIRNLGARLLLVLKARSTLYNIQIS
jgi:hypothetical protein